MYTFHRYGLVFRTLLLVVFLGFLQTTYADEMSDVWAAYKRGDYVTAFKGYQKLAEQGNVSAQLNLGQMYFSGQGTTQDYKEAAKWYSKAAKQGDAVAQYNLGKAYQNGIGVKQSNKKALKWFRKAAKQGDASAQNSLGVMYESGAGVKQNHKKAAEWYRKAATQTVLAWHTMTAEG